MIERAIRKRWLTTDDVKAIAMDAVQRGLTCGDDRAEQRAIGNLLAMEAQNQKDEHKVVDVNVATRHDQLAGIAADLGIEVSAIEDATREADPRAGGTETSSPEIARNDDRT